MIVLVIAWYLCVAFDIYLAYAPELNYFEAILAAPTVFAFEKEVFIAYIGDLAIGLLFAILGIGYYFYYIIRKKKAQAATNAPKDDNTSDNNN